DCWAELNRDSQGNFVPKAATFPSGIKALADYVHGKGLKLGIYSDAG
ncbi:alpha-galactosidase, partial [Tanacetum coccineum]